MRGQKLVSFLPRIYKAGSSLTSCCQICLPGWFLECGWMRAGFPWPRRDGRTTAEKETMPVCWVPLRVTRLWFGMYKMGTRSCVISESMMRTIHSMKFQTSVPLFGSLPKNRATGECCLGTTISMIFTLAPIILFFISSTLLPILLVGIFLFLGIRWNRTMPHFPVPSQLYLFALRGI